MTKYTKPKKLKFVEEIVRLKMGKYDLGAR